MKTFGFCRTLMLGIGTLPIACSVATTDMDKSDEVTQSAEEFANSGEGVATSAAELGPPQAVRDGSELELPPGYARLSNGQLAPLVKAFESHALSPEDQSKLEAFKLTLPTATATSIDRRMYQTPVKNQNPFGSCETFSTVGAIEAAYMRRCIDNPSLPETYCNAYWNSALTGGAKPLDLSEQYWMTRFYSGLSTRNAQAEHENESHACGTMKSYYRSDATWAHNGWFTHAAVSMLLPEEQYAPYFGNDDKPLPIGHFGVVEARARDGWTFQALIADSGPYAFAPSQGAFCMTSEVPPGGFMGNPGIQKRFDSFNYDPTQVSYAAGYEARYGASEMQYLPDSEVKDPANLERYLAGGYEVILGLDLTGVDWGGVPVVNGGSVWTYDPNSTINQGKGHSVLAVGYDRNTKRILAKNSWGPNDNPYIWLSYDCLRNRATKGVVVVSVHPTNTTPTREAAARGLWHVYNSDGTYAGNMAIHRTRNAADASADAYQALPVTVRELDALKNTSRLGTFYPWQGTTLGSPRVVAGALSSGRISIGIGPVTGLGGDSIATIYPSLENWGSMVIDSPERAHDGAGHIYLRDYSNRADKNWRGQWTLEIGTTPVSTATLRVDSVSSYARSDGTYSATGRYQAGTTTYNVTGTIDQAGAHGRFSYRPTCSTMLCVQRTVTIDASFFRGAVGSTVTDFILDSSTITTTPPLTVLGKTVPPSRVWGKKVGL